MCCFRAHEGWSWWSPRVPHARRGAETKPARMHSVVREQHDRRIFITSPPTPAGRTSGRGDQHQQAHRCEDRARPDPHPQGGPRWGVRVPACFFFRFVFKCPKMPPKKGRLFRIQRGAPFGTPSTSQPPCVPCPLAPARPAAETPRAEGIAQRRGGRPGAAAQGAARRAPSPRRVLRVRAYGRPVRR